MIVKAAYTLDPYEMGRQAHAAKIPDAYNPFPVETTAREQWADGWRAAAREHAELMAEDPVWDSTEDEQ